MLSTYLLHVTHRPHSPGSPTGTGWWPIPSFPVYPNSQTESAKDLTARSGAVADDPGEQQAEELVSEVSLHNQVLLLMAAFLFSRFSAAVAFCSLFDSFLLSII